MLGFGGQENKSFCILLKAFAALKEENQLLQGLFIDLVVVLDEVLEGVAEQDGVLLLDANGSQQID